MIAPNATNSGTVTQASRRPPTGRRRPERTTAAPMLRSIDNALGEVEQSGPERGHTASSLTAAPGSWGARIQRGGQTRARPTRASAAGRRAPGRSARSARRAGPAAPVSAARSGAAPRGPRRYCPRPARTLGEVIQMRRAAHAPHRVSRRKSGDGILLLGGLVRVADLRALERRRLLRRGSEVDLDLARLLLLGLRNRDLQDTTVEVGGHLVGVDPVGQGERPGERAERALH